MNLHQILCALCAATIVASSPLVSRATSFFGPVNYLSAADTPDEFHCDLCDQCVSVLEDFEDNSLDHGLTIEGFDGQILYPGFGTGLDGLTDSVDADDGAIDGIGNEGYSYFSPGNTLTIHFPTAVKAAGVVWTDGDIGSQTLFEAYGPDGLTYSYGPVSLADMSFQGTTAEDTFFGVQDANGITHLVLTNIGGLGIEIDHIQYEDCDACAAIPEPNAAALLCFGALGVVGFRRRNR